MILALLAACAGGPSDTGDSSVPLDPTFTNVKTEIFEVSCQSSSCHGGRGSHGLSLDDDVAYGEIVNVESQDAEGEILVVPGDPESSYLFRKCSGDDDIVGVPMPKGSPSLDDERLALLQAWIEAGAADD